MHHRSRARAVYRLTDCSQNTTSPSRLATNETPPSWEITMARPRGCCVHEAVGGPVARAHVLHGVDLALAALGSRARQTRGGAGSSLDTSAPKPSSAKRLSSTTAPSMAARLGDHPAHLEDGLLELLEIRAGVAGEVGPVDRRRSSSPPPARSRICKSSVR